MKLIRSIYFFLSRNFNIHTYLQFEYNGLESQQRHKEIMDG
jgi:hypothetical protein